MRLILASASPRRAELLRAAGFAFEIVATNVDEHVLDGETPAAYVQRLARAKAGAIDVRDAIVIGADTSVVVDGAILGKPIDDPHAANMLRRLSGRTHEVLTGLSVRSGNRELTRVEMTRVEFSRSRT